MIKIICSNQQEKSELIEAAEQLNKLAAGAKLSRKATFLVELYKNTNAIEIADGGFTTKFDAPKYKFRTSKRNNRDHNQNGRRSNNTGEKDSISHSGQYDRKEKNIKPRRS